MERNTIDQTIRNLRERQFEAFFAGSKEEAISLIEELQFPGSACGSFTSGGERSDQSPFFCGCILPFS